MAAENSDTNKKTETEILRQKLEETRKDNHRKAAQLQHLNEKFQASNEKLRSFQAETKSLTLRLTAVNRRLREKIDELEKTNEAMRESEQRLRLVLENSRDGIHMVDLHQNRYVFMSPSQQELTGFTREELNFSMEQAETRLHPDDIQTVNRYLSSVIAGQPPTQPMEYRWRVKSGEYRWFSDSRKVVRDERGNRVALVGISRDITDRKGIEEQLRQNESQFRQLADSMPQLVWITRPDGYPEYFNRRWYEFTGTVEEETVGEMWARLLHPDDYQHTLDAWHHSLRTGEPYTIEYRFRRGGDNTYHWFLGRAMPVRNQHGDITRWFGTCTYLQEQKEAEEKLRRRSVELARANRELEAFSYSVSHDLRTPLNTMSLFGELLGEHYSEMLDDDGREIVSKMQKETKKMGALIDDLLSLSRISRQDMSIQDVNMSRVARDIIEELSSGAPQRRVNVTIHENLNTRGDEKLLKLALTNLLSNAWKYTGKTPDPRIEFGSLDREGETVFYIRDNGAGFPMDQSEKLFTPFQRLHGEDEFCGTGIGLPIAARVFDRHNGRIWGQSEIGKGATFYFCVSPIGEG